MRAIFAGRHTGADARAYNDVANFKNSQAFNNTLETKNLCLYCDHQYRAAAKTTECSASAIP
jgi:hypothetical protein